MGTEGKFKVAINWLIVGRVNYMVQINRDEENLKWTDVPYIYDNMTLAEYKKMCRAHIKDAKKKIKIIDEAIEILQNQESD